MLESVVGATFREFESRILCQLTCADSAAHIGAVPAGRISAAGCGKPPQGTSAGSWLYCQIQPKRIGPTRWRTHDTKPLCVPIGQGTALPLMGHAERELPGFTTHAEGRRL